MKGRALIVIVAVALVAAVSAVPAGADPIGGATYRGVAADGAMVQFTVSSDGTLVNSYAISGVNGQVPGGGTCQFVAEGQNGTWEGAPIANKAFGYQLRNQILFQGTFNGAQAASGIFQLYSPAGNGSPACDTGTVSWTATTTATPGGGPGGQGGGSGQGGNGGGGHKSIFLTRITFRKASTQLLLGQIKSSHGTCRAGRTVVLWMGRHRIASTKSKAGGKFSFARAARIRGRAVRASTPAKNMPAGSCAAGSSTFIKG
jgi:hypothetical protein